MATAQGGWSRACSCAGLRVPFATTMDASLDMWVFAGRVAASMACLLVLQVCARRRRRVRSSARWVRMRDSNFVRAFSSAITSVRGNAANGSSCSEQTHLIRAMRRSDRDEEVEMEDVSWKGAHAAGSPGRPGDIAAGARMAAVEDTREEERRQQCVEGGEDAAGRLEEGLHTEGRDSSAFLYSGTNVAQVRMPEARRLGVQVEDSDANRNCCGQQADAACTSSPDGVQGRDVCHIATFSSEESEIRAPPGSMVTTTDRQIPPSQVRPEPFTFEEEPGHQFGGNGFIADFMAGGKSGPLGNHSVAGNAEVDDEKLRSTAAEPLGLGEAAAITSCADHEPCPDQAEEEKEKGEEAQDNMVAAAESRHFGGNGFVPHFMTDWNAAARQGLHSVVADPEAVRYPMGTLPQSSSTAAGPLGAKVVTCVDHAQTQAEEEAWDNIMMAAEPSRDKVITCADHGCQTHAEKKAQGNIIASAPDGLRRVFSPIAPLALAEDTVKHFREEECDRVADFVRGGDDSVMQNHAVAGDAGGQPDDELRSTGGADGDLGVDVNPDGGIDVEAVPRPVQEQKVEETDGEKKAEEAEEEGEESGTVASEADRFWGAPQTPVLPPVRRLRRLRKQEAVQLCERELPNLVQDREEGLPCDVVTGGAGVPSEEPCPPCSSGIAAEALAMEVMHPGEGWRREPPHATAVAIATSGSGQRASSSSALLHALAEELRQFREQAWLDFEPGTEAGVKSQIVNIGGDVDAASTEDEGSYCSIASDFGGAGMRRCGSYRDAGRTLDKEEEEEEEGC